MKFIVYVQAKKQRKRDRKNGLFVIELNNQNSYMIFNHIPFPRDFSVSPFPQKQNGSTFIQ